MASGVFAGSAAAAFASLHMHTSDIASHNPDSNHSVLPERWCIHDTEDKMPPPATAHFDYRLNEGERTHLSGSAQCCASTCSSVLSSSHLRPRGDPKVAVVNWRVVCCTNTQHNAAGNNSHS